MNKAIVANSIIALASIGTVILLSVNAMDIPEEPVPLNVTTIMTTALSQVTTRCSTTNISSTTRAITTTEMTTTPCTTLESLELQEDVCETETCDYHEEIYIPEVEELPCTEVISEPIEEYLVYKPSTKYVHRSSCRWNSGDAIVITDTNDIVARKCTECNPDIEIVNEYIEPEIPDQTCSVCLSDSDKYYLAIMITHECSSRAGAEHNAHSVAAMVNRGGTIYNTISSSCCPWWGRGHGSWCMDNGCTNGLDTSYAYEAIDYYLNNSNSYSWVTGWCASGDGIHNSYY